VNKVFAMKSSYLICILAYIYLTKFTSAQQAQCVTLQGGCDQGVKGATALKDAISVFEPGFLYGGAGTTVFSSSVFDDTLALISYSCLDGSVPPPADGGSIQILYAAPDNQGFLSTMS
jgi:hypothetical protein